MLSDMEKELQEFQETKVDTTDIFDGVILHVKKDTVRLPDGKLTGREIIRHVGAVCVIPVNEKNEVIVERQYRYPIDAVITEIPAGKLDSRQEDRLSAAKRELLEETGITADTWIDLGPYYGAPAYSDEYITMYLAQGLHQGEQKLDEGEFLSVMAVPLSELLSDAMTGRIPDGKTQLAVLKAARYLGL